MSAQKTRVDEMDPDGRWLYLVGGVSAVLLCIAYVIIIAIYVLAGGPPQGGGAEAWLTFLARNTSAWWGILGLSVFTDLLLVPIMLALYYALKRINKSAMLLAALCVGLFVVLELAITWTNYAALITLSGRYVAATSEVQRGLFLAAANYSIALLESPHLLGIYTIAVTGVGYLITSIVMLRGVFSRGVAYLGVTHSVLSLVSVVGPIFISSLSVTIVIASALSVVWFLLIGCRLYRLGRAGQKMNRLGMLDEDQARPTSA